MRRLHHAQLFDAAHRPSFLCVRQRCVHRIPHRLASHLDWFAAGNAVFKPSDVTELVNLVRYLACF